MATLYQEKGGNSTKQKERGGKRVEEEKEVKKPEQTPTTRWSVRREDFEKMVIVMNHSTRPFMDFCFNPEQKRKVKVVMEYDPDNSHVDFNYYVEDKE